MALRAALRKAGPVLAWLMPAVVTFRHCLSSLPGAPGPGWAPRVAEHIWALLLCNGRGHDREHDREQCVRSSDIWGKGRLHSSRKRWPRAIHRAPEEGGGRGAHVAGLPAPRPWGAALTCAPRQWRVPGGGARGALGWCRLRGSASRPRKAGHLGMCVCPPVRLVGVAVHRLRCQQPQCVHDRDDPDGPRHTLRTPEWSRAARIAVGLPSVRAFGPVRAAQPRGHAAQPPLPLRPEGWVRLCLRSSSNCVVNFVCCFSPPSGGRAP